MDIGARIRRFRRERDWTQAELAELVGIDKRNISRYESGHVEPRKRTLLKFAEALQVEVGELLGTITPSAEEPLSDDPELFRLVKEVANLPEENKEALKKIMEIMVREHRIQSAIAS